MNLQTETENEIAIGNNAEKEQEIKGRKHTEIRRQK